MEYEALQTYESWSDLVVIQKELQVME